jgi:hypothetical protein
LVQLLKVKNVSKKHLILFNWARHGKVMHEVLLESTKDAFAFANFIGNSANEVTTIDNTQWPSIYPFDL